MTRRHTPQLLTLDAILPRLRWRAGTRYTAREIALYLLRGTLLKKYRHQIAELLEKLGISRHAYYNAREYLQAHGIVRTRKRGQYRATRAELVHIDPPRMLEVLFGGDIKAFSRALGLPPDRLAQRYPELYAAMHEPELMHAFAVFQATYPSRGSRIPFIVLLPEFVNACRKYGIETVLHKTRLYREQQDALAKATGGRAGTGTRYVMTVENFLRKLHEINAPKERERERAVQIVARLLEAHFGVNPSEAAAFLATLEPSVVRDFATDSGRKSTLAQYPDYDSVRRYLTGISEMRRNRGLVAVNAAKSESPPEPVSNAAPAPVQLSPETLDAIVRELQRHGIIRPEDAHATRALLERKPRSAMMIGHALNAGNHEKARMLLSHLRC
jgi:DNA-binding Lrp family transcriptional regulator